MWGVPVDHSMFGELSTAQWLWYYYSCSKDREEKYEHNRDMVEYNASFVEPEAVRKIRDARENTVAISDDQFNAGLEQIFGKALDTSGSKKAVMAEEKTDNKKSIEYSDWTKLKLG
jgi:hypothetical protein